MTRDEMVARMTSQELTGWMALFQVRGEEQELDKLRASTSDGQVTITGRHDDDEDED